MIHKELFKKFKFDHTNKSVRENETHRLPWNFEIKAYHLISGRRPDLVIVNKKVNLPNSGLCRSGRPQIKIERK